MEEQNNKLLDKDGNPITKEIIESKLKEIFIDSEPLLKKCEWEEDGKIYHTWKINAGKHESGRIVTGYTNDAGAEMMQKAMEEWIKNNINAQEKNTTKDKDSSQQS